MVNRRAKEMHITKVFQKVGDKEKIYKEICSEVGKLDEEICFVGDELADIPLLRLVGVGIAVFNAVEDVKSSADYVTDHSGGNGAVREVVELLLKAKGKWQEVLEDFSKKG